MSDQVTDEIARVAKVLVEHSRHDCGACEGSGRWSSGVEGYPEKDCPDCGGFGYFQAGQYDEGVVAGIKSFVVGRAVHLMAARDYDLAERYLLATHQYGMLALEQNLRDDPEYGDRARGMIQAIKDEFGF